MTPEPWLLLAFAVSVVATFLFTLVAERVGKRLQVLDRPRPGEVQKAVVPRTGGYAMLGGLWLGLLVAYLLRGHFLVDPELGSDWISARS